MPEPLFEPDPPAAPDVFSSGASAVQFPGTMASFVPTQKPKTERPKPQSLDDLTAKVSAEEAGLLKEKIGAEGGMAAAQERRDAQYRERMNRALAAESATADELKPWNAGEELAKRQTSLWDQFGSPGFVVAMIGSAFTAMPMNSALNAGAAAMNAINQGNMDDYNKSFDAWKENTRLVEKRLDLEERQFNQIDKLRSSDMESWRAQATALLNRFNDRRKLLMLENGMDDEVIGSLAAQAKARADIADSRERLEKNEVRRQVFNALLGDKKDPQAIAQASADADLVASGDAKTPEQIVIRNLISQPGFRDQPVAEQNKQIQDAVRNIASARYGGHTRPADAEQQRQMDAWDSEHPDATQSERDAAHIDIIKNVSVAQKPASAGTPSMAKEQAQLVEDLVKETNPATGKLYTREEAIKRAKEAGAPPITGNKALDAKSHIGQYDDAMKLIDGIDKTLNKYVGAAGLAGRATRLTERVGNILGSNQTDRTQMMRDISQLQLMGPRLLLDQKTGRPLSAEAGHISDIIAGLSLGDTTANTLRAMKELRDRLKVIRDRDAAALGGGAAPAPATETIEDKPWENDPIQK